MLSEEGNKGRACGGNGEKIGEFAANLFTQFSAKMSDCYENPVYHLNDRW